MRICDDLKFMFPGNEVFGLLLGRSDGYQTLKIDMGQFGAQKVAVDQRGGFETSQSIEYQPA